MNSDTISIVIIGASGNLARTKIVPALFSLFCQGFLPLEFRIYGFARSRLSDSEFRKKLAESLTCRYTPGEKDCAGKMDEFLSRCHYVEGTYGQTDSYLDLYQVMQQYEGAHPANRMFYLAVPPAVFADVAKALGDTGLVSCVDDTPWTRVVVEKPFGRDRASSDELTGQLAQIFTESQTYRIDHYLGKEVIQNLLVLRFANLVFEPLWNRDYIDSIEINWKEDIGVEGRGGYFDNYGIIRDVIQNHLLQILALVAIECPESLSAPHVMKAKQDVLQSIHIVGMKDLQVGQYRGYCEDETVPAGSKTPTFAKVGISINNERWQGVPFTITAGKGLEERMSEIRVKFKNVSGSLFCDNDGCSVANELVIRVQPDESINLRLMTKVPGMGMRLDVKDLDLRYGAVFDNIIPDAYESLIYDVFRGDKGLFIGKDELAVAWDIFTPVLRELEEAGAEPESYELGGQGPGES